MREFSNRPFGQPSAGFFLAIDFSIASFHSRSILSESYLWPSFARFFLSAFFFVFIL